MNEQRIDVEGILNTLSSIRQQIPKLGNVSARTPVDDTAGMEAFVPGGEEAIEAFELGTLAGALESLADDLSASIEAAEQKVMADALEIYYAAERLSKEPEHAHLIPYVEEMQAIYRRDFGREIPVREHPTSRT